MNYGYIRVSTEKQTVKNQKFEINNYATARQIQIETWIEETISATKKLEDRKFGQLLKKLDKGDLVVVSELSRLGRNLMQIMSILHLCMERGVKIFTVKEGYELGDNINSKVLAFAFGLSAEIERNLISQRTKEALARKKAEGVVLGRPKGSSKPEHYKLHSQDPFLELLLRKKYTYSKIAKKLKVHRLTVAKYINADPYLFAIAKEMRPRKIK